mgnify:CR=1 FL=1
MTGFVERKVAFCDQHGITEKRPVTGNIFECVDTRSPRRVLERCRIGHIRARPHRPQANGNIERFHQAMADEWVYGMAYGSPRALPC